MKLRPEVFYYKGMTHLIKDLTWNINSLRAGISLIITPEPSGYVFHREHIIKEYFDTVRVHTDSLFNSDVKKGITRVDSTEFLTRDTIFVTVMLKRTDTLFIMPKLKASLKIVSGNKIK